MKTTYDTGLAGEKLAEDFLSGEKGMRCIERRLRTRCGEIDLVMLDGETVVFVEVKTRLKGHAGDGMTAVTFSKQKRISQGAQLYLMRRGWLSRMIRFDVVELTMDGIIYAPDAFQPGGIIFGGHI